MTTLLHLAATGEEVVLEVVGICIFLGEVAFLSCGSSSVVVFHTARELASVPLDSPPPAHFSLLWLK